MLSLLRREEKIIPHYYRGKNYARDLRESYITQPPKRKEAYCVFGEFSSVSTVKKCLENGYIVNVLMGPEIYEGSKNEIITLKIKYQEKFRIYQAESRPDSHGILINDNLFFEDYHDDKQYEHAKFIKNASRREISFFITSFLKDISSLNELNIGDLRNCPTTATA